MPHVVLTFELAEEVTPSLFARRVAQACFDYGALRPGEHVLAEDRQKVRWSLQDRATDDQSAIIAPEQV